MIVYNIPLYQTFFMKRVRVTMTISKKFFIYVTTNYLGKQSYQSKVSRELELAHGENVGRARMTLASIRHFLETSSIQTEFSSQAGEIYVNYMLGFNSIFASWWLAGVARDIYQITFTKQLGFRWIEKSYKAVTLTVLDSHARILTASMYYYTITLKLGTQKALG